MAAKIPMMAITIISSIKVKPFCNVFTVNIPVCGFGDGVWQAILKPYVPMNVPTVWAEAD